ncbi:hypothetical protein K678_01381 [Magnetospirillum fulvum MGU-K5]|uniref:Uncharacterized protein n=2 Tax=Magnetospirillum fulvum TaxID=1082 RepID=S9SGM9_MAGFU|nr:hypothetical protein K678_01381 [Magnetospirillum fulvum MGU-K5]
MPLASSVVAAAIRSAAFCWRAKVRAFLFLGFGQKPTAAELFGSEGLRRRRAGHLVFFDESHSESLSSESETYAKTPT